MWRHPAATLEQALTKEGVEKAIKNYWSCVDRLAKEKVDHIIFSGAPISAMLTRPRVLDLLRGTKERTGISADAPLEALIAESLSVVACPIGASLRCDPACCRPAHGGRAGHHAANTAPAAPATPSGAERIRELKRLLDDGLISPEEFEIKRKQLLQEM